MTYIALVPPIVYDVVQYEADPTGVLDSTTKIADARSAANAAGGGIVFYPPGTYLSGNQPIYSHVRDIGAGPGITIVKLKSGANTDLFSGQVGSINLSAAPGTGSVGALLGFGFENMTLDGNKANQTGGPSYPLRFYGYNFRLSNLIIKNGYSDGALIDWNGGNSIVAPSDQMESVMENIKFHDNSGAGLRMGGPNDTRVSNLLSFGNGSHGFHIAPNAAGLLCTQIHPWANAQGVNGVGILCEASFCHFVNCTVEGSDTVQFAALANDISFIGGAIFGNVGFAGVGLQLGQNAGNTPFPGQIFQSGGLTTAQSVTGVYVKTKMLNLTNGAISEVNVGRNYLDVQAYQTSGTAIVGGYPNAQTTLILSVTGLTPDGSPGKGGGVQIPNDSFNGYRFIDKNNNAIFNVDTHDSALLVPNGAGVYGYSDNGSTITYILNAADGSLKLGNSSALRSGTGAPAAGLGANGDYYFRTDTPGTVNQRIYVKSAGAWVALL